MKFLEFISTVNLFEAAKDRYTQMFTNLIPAFTAVGKERYLETVVDGEISWAMNTLKKQDKVIWYMRFVKLNLLAEMAAKASSAVDDEEQIYAPFPNMWEKYANQLGKKMGLDARETTGVGRFAIGRIFKQNMEHFMSLGLPALDQYVFANQAPQQILDDWTPIEDAWKARRKSTLPIDREGIDTVIKYLDGSEWVNLNEEYCTAEGDAMGHCGNSAEPKEGDTVISYRTIEVIDGEELWKPRLTFILDRNGLLGETKGRANQKPDQKYHDVIVDLLRQDFVKGIKGGGYEPENNFHFEDLPEDVQDKLVEEKPGLASIRYDYEKRGMTQQLVHRIQAMWEDIESTMPEYKDGSFLHPTKGTVHEFLNDHGGDTGKWITDVLTGEQHLDIWFDSQNGDDLFYSLSPEVKTEVGKWIIANHPDMVEEWKEENDQDYDGTEERATWDIINENGIDEIQDALQRAEMRGHESGAENEMYQAAKSWIDDLPNEHDHTIGLSPGWDADHDDMQFLSIPEATMIDLTDHLEEIQYEGGIFEYLNIKEVEQPYHGFNEYDEDSAKEDALYHLSEAGVIE